MPFTVRTRTIHYIDTSDATPDNYIEVHFENGSKMTLVASLNGGRSLRVDRNRTSPTILEELYASYALFIEKQSFWVRRDFARLKRKQNVRDKLAIYIWTTTDSESTNAFPEAGRKLPVMVGHPVIRQTEVIVHSPIKSVKFY